MYPKIIRLLQFSLKLFFPLLLMSNTLPTQAQSPSPEQVVQQNLDAYNRRDIEGFMRSFSDSIAICELRQHEPVTVGLSAVRTRYAQLFERSPNLHSDIVLRIVLGNKVIDHERITGRNGATEPVELVLIYEVQGSTIFRITVIRK
jgi:hypothetical protein